MGGHVQRKGIIVPTIIKSMYHSHDTNFKLMVIKKTKKKPITVPQHGNCVSLNRMFLRRRKKILLLHGPNSTQETFHGQK